ncbi:MAG: pilin [bacterium]
MKKSINKAIYVLLVVSIAFSALLFTVQAQNVTPAQLQAQITQLQQQIAQAQQANKTAQVAQLQQQLNQLQMQQLSQALQFKTGVSLSNFTPAQLQQQLNQLQLQLMQAQTTTKASSTQQLGDQIAQLQAELQKRNENCSGTYGQCIPSVLWNGAYGDFAMFDSSQVLSGGAVQLKVDFRGNLFVPKGKDTQLVLGARSATAMFDKKSEASKIELLAVDANGKVTTPQFFGLPNIQQISGMSNPINQTDYTKYCTDIVGQCVAMIEIIGAQTGMVYFQSNDFVPNIPMLGVTTNPFASTTKPVVDYTGKEASGLATSTALGKNLTSSQSISELLIVCDGVKVPCTFGSAMLLLQNVIKLLLTKVAFLMFMFGLFYVGWVFINSGGDVKARGKAKDTLKALIIGYVVALCAWVIVKTIIVMFAGEKPSFDTFF